MTVAESQKLAQQRLADIATRQAALAAKVTQIQARLAATLDAASEAALGQPARFDVPLVKWAKTELLDTVSQWAGDILAVGQDNGKYFRQVAGSAKDYLAAQAQAVPLLLDRFGLTPTGGIVPGGFFGSFLGDTTLAAKVKQAAWKAKASGTGLVEFKNQINALVAGTPGGAAGLVERHFNTFAYDTYQQADAQTQDFYAVKLDLPAALYLGGEIAGTREFCHERQGNVYTRQEIAGWAKLEFNGKTPDYNPFTDRGGYNCRHHLHYITARMAAARRTDLTVGPDGKLYAAGESLPVVVAPAGKTAPVAQPPVVVQVENSPVPAPSAAPLSPKTPAIKPAVYSTLLQLEKAAEAGGWTVEDASLAKFNNVVGGLDLKRLGIETEQILTKAGIQDINLSVHIYQEEVTISASGKYGNEARNYDNRFTMDRRFSHDRKTGERTVSHDLLIVPKYLQGTGLGKDLLNALNNEYKAAKIKAINVHANISVGGYSWAKYGFSAQDMQQAERVLNYIEARVTPAGKPILAKMKAVKNRFYAKNSEETPFPMDKLANIPGAKQLMLGSDWYGTIDLTDAKRRKIWELYIAK